jgi:hypothetical protein
VKRTAILVALLALLLVVGNALAMSSDSYRLDWYVVLTGGGGGAADSTHYATNYTFGQTARGLSSSDNYEVGLGYWYGVGKHRVLLPLVLRGF